MKAKKWAERFKPTVNDQILSDVQVQLCKEYVDEIVDLIRKRGLTIAAVEGAFREAFQKWDAICKIIKDEYFDDRILMFACEEYCPDLWNRYNEYATDNYIKQRIKRIYEQAKKDREKILREAHPGTGIILLALMLDTHYQIEELRKK